MNWTPITFEELKIEISNGEHKMDQNLLDFWNKIKTVPKKWSEAEYGDEGNGFWVVAKFKNLVVYYNDIEEGFNISEFKYEGEIQEYGAEQDELNFAIYKLVELKNYLFLS
ncbi:hypothetical protein [Sphingobacterium anhuiense]|uniref:Phage protein n=1 Tax=Sphingobacterium anhuiense TaxID=493780 RepID=A0ABW5YWA1_9SPHI